MSAKGRSGNLVKDVFRPQVGYGIMRSFGVAGTDANLDLAVTAGWILTKDGPVYLQDSDFANIGPADDGILTASDTTVVFFSPRNYAQVVANSNEEVPQNNTATSAAIYSNLTGTRQYPDDIVLFKATTDATTVTDTWVGEWVNTHVLSLKNVVLTAAADLVEAAIPGFHPRNYLFDIWAILTADVTVSTAILSFQQLDPTTTTSTEMSTLTLPVQTFDLDVRANIIRPYFVGTAIDTWYRDRILVVECTDTATAGNVDLYLKFGGYVPQD